MHRALQQVQKPQYGAELIDLIKQAIKINNRIFQRERANKGNNKTIPVYRVLQ